MPVGSGLLVAIWAACPITVPDVELPRANGELVRLSEYMAGWPVAVVFVGVDCPVANLYGPRLRDLAKRLGTDRVRLLAVIPGRHDDKTAVAEFARKHRLPFACVLDADLQLADALGATRTPEAFVLDAGRRVRYRGRIDDQYRAGGVARAAPTREDLYEAAREVAAGRRVSVPMTQATGCVIAREKNPAKAPLTYSRDIQPILRHHCETCHRPGEVAPFALQTYADARRRAATIVEAVADGRMPPWHASPLHGRFRNDRSLNDGQKRAIAEWVRQGCPEGNPSEVLPPLAPAERWAIGTPDVVFPIPVEFEVPEQGIVEYQHFIVDPGFDQDTWVRAAEVRPGNRKVVHHCNVFLQPPNCTDPKAMFETGPLGSSNLIAWTPGSGAVQLPPGMAKLIPARSRLHFIVHYTPIGTRQTDRTELGLILCPPSEVRQEVATKLLDDENLTIPPHAARHRVEKTWRAEMDVLLLSMFPHMHLRGKSFRYEAEFPDGGREVLLDVPAYDFNWQHRYELIEPRRLPAGTVIRCVAEYDNSVGNPANPDPTATVREGQQSTDEMFNGFFDIAVADQDLASEKAGTDRLDSRRRIAMVVAGLGAALAFLWAVRIWRK